MSLIGMLTHPLIIVSQEHILNSVKIENDDNFYEILKLLDPKANVFYCKIEWRDNMPAFHFLVNNDYRTNWINEKKCYAFYETFVSRRPYHVGLIGEAYTTDNDLIVEKRIDKISRIGDLDKFHAKNVREISNYFATIFCATKTNLTSQYLEFVSYNLFLSNTLSFGFSGNLKDFNSNKILIKFNNHGMISKIPSY
jgi:hypothetical protein